MMTNMFLNPSQYHDIDQLQSYVIEDKIENDEVSVSSDGQSERGVSSKKESIKSFPISINSHECSTSNITCIKKSDLRLNWSKSIQEPQDERENLENFDRKVQTCTNSSTSLKYNTELNRKSKLTRAEKTARNRAKLLTTAKVDDFTSIEEQEQGFLNQNRDEVSHGSAKSPVKLLTIVEGSDFTTVEANTDKIRSAGNMAVNTLSGNNLNVSENCQITRSKKELTRQEKRERNNCRPIHLM